MSTISPACNVILDNERGELRDRIAPDPTSEAETTQPEAGHAPVNADAEPAVDAAAEDAESPPRNGRCGPGTKPCGTLCVARHEPSFGCAAPSCTPCTAPHAYAGCNSAGRCSVSTCEPGFADCDGDAEDGCETDLMNDADNCGACGARCRRGRCIEGACRRG